MKIYTFEQFVKAPHKFRFSIYEKKRKKYCDNIFCFDIEVSSYFVKGKNVFGISDVFKRFNYDIGRVEDFFQTCKYGALPYIWQFTIDGETVIIGRELPQFLNLVRYLNKKIGAFWYCFVHNLAYEYAFIREYFNFEKVFFTESRKPLYANYDNCQFRCTYRLTNLSLAKWGQQCGVDKKVGDLDYTILRTPKTELTEKEMNYCVYDLLVMVKGLEQYRKQYGHIKEIPLTLTGQIRRRVKALYNNDIAFKNYVASIMPKNYDEFLVQSKTFGGGYVASNIRHTNVLLHDILSRDIASAYPWQVFSKKYPCAPFTLVNAPCNWYDGNAHICLVEFTRLESINDLCVIPYSKRIAAQGVQFDNYENKKGLIALNNGKVRRADKFIMYCTEQDFQLYSMFYKFKSAKVLTHRIAPVDYIDKRFIMLMLELYKNKTELKGVDDEIYLQSKALLNSMSYGLMATAPCRDRYDEIDYLPQVYKCDEISGNAQLMEFQEKPYKNVVPYVWGLYVTSYQRKRLLMIAKKLSTGVQCRVAYGDTDSLKGKFTAEDLQVFEDENKQVLETIARICKERDINPAYLSPQDKDGNTHTMGVWENDGRYSDFKAMHAKCYAFIKQGETKTGITIAGVPKACGAMLSSPDELTNGLTFDIFNSRKNITTYLDGDNPLVTMPDGYKVKNTCGINLHPTSYTLTLTTEYKELLKMYNNKHNISCV